jgi:hypothetical protein
MEAHSLQVKEQLGHASLLLQDIKQEPPTQALALRNVHAMLSGLYILLVREAKTSLHHFGEVVNKVW